MSWKQSIIQHIKRFTRSFSLMRYGSGQHELICEATGTGKDFLDDGCSAYEAVCVLMYKLDTVKTFLVQQNNDESIEMLNFLNTHQDDEEFSIIPLYGTEKCC